MSSEPIKSCANLPRHRDQFLGVVVDSEIYVRLSNDVVRVKRGAAASPAHPMNKHWRSKPGSLLRFRRVVEIRFDLIFGIVQWD